MKNISLQAFAQSIGATSVDFVKNPHTGKLFASFNNGQTSKVEQAIDFSAPIEVLIDESGESCIINKRANNTVHSMSLA